MIIRLDEHPDHGRWISDDRIYAFISAASHGISEVGFHGLQPVSRNSRLLVHPEGVLSIGIRTERDEAFRFDTVDWNPGSVQTSIFQGGKEYRLLVETAGRSLLLTVMGMSTSNAAVFVRFFLSSLYTEVHGERLWSKPSLQNGKLHLQCRDRIVLRDWLRRKGPYAGDFLIPEPWRRIIFRRRCRSGTATPDDLRPEYRDSRIALYDAETWIRMGGEQFSAVVEDDVVTFSSRLSQAEGNHLEFRLECAEDPSLFNETPAVALHPMATDTFKGSSYLSPELKLPGYPNVEEFFSTVPGIVRSCIVHDIGMTRATPGAYYWIWAWDNLVTALEMPRWKEISAAGRIVRFINAHRDANGAIPGRWTRSYQPLDTPQPGALEFLLLLLATAGAFETGEKRDILEIYPYAVSHLKDVASRSNAQGLTGNIGFYPDFPQKFGRSEHSATAMETGATYAFCRLLEDLARELGDNATVGQAEDLAGRICSSFDSTFWDDEKGFLRDSIDLENGKVNASYPLFSLLFLQTPLALSLIRPFILPMARYAREHLQSPNGIRLLPDWDTRKENEDALSSWYPHWDLYLLKLLRRARDRDGIILWLQAVERVLLSLGYAPEFLALDGFTPDDPATWRRHGAVSNLNCVTGWYRSIIEGLFGIEFDPGGMTILPLDLPLGTLTLRRLVHRRSEWDIRIENGGSSLDTIRIDGQPLRGCTKIPSRFHDGNPHRVEIIYGRKESPLLFTELINAEVLESGVDEAKASVTVRALGTADIAFPLVAPLRLCVDGTEVPYSRDSQTHTGFTQLPLYGKHELTLSKTLHS